MAAIAERVTIPEIRLTGLPLPVTVRPAVAITDDELMSLSRNNRSYRMERNARGELEIMSPSGGDGSRWESRVIRELDLWAEEYGGASFSSSGGFHLPDGSVLSPMRPGFPNSVGITLARRSGGPFLPYVRILQLRSSPPATRARSSNPGCWFGPRMEPDSPG